MHKTRVRLPLKPLKSIRAPQHPIKSISQRKAVGLRQPQALRRIKYLRRARRKVLLEM